jgi:hypothetical protein
MKEIARILCGSHLYGTNVEGSDKDYKVVFIPDPEDILLGRGRGRCEKGPEGDVEYMSLQQYLKLLCQGQTVALDMLFAPEACYEGQPEAEWFAIRRHGPSFLSRNCKAFVGYCRQQAGKYVIKLERFQALGKVVEKLQQAPAEARLLEHLEGLLDLVDTEPHMEWVTHSAKHIMKEVAHLSVCQTEVPITATIKLALSTYQRKLDQYGERVRAAEDLGEKDWKSMYHAVRVGHQAIELMETGKLTFPRPERDLLLAIRQGKLPLKEVGETIEENLDKVQEAAEASSLPEEPDWGLAERLTVSFYQIHILAQHAQARLQ